MQAKKPFGDTEYEHSARLQDKNVVELREDRRNHKRKASSCPVCDGPVAGIVTRGPSTHLIEPCGCSVGPLTVREVLTTTDESGARAEADSVDDHLLRALEAAEEPRVRELIREALQHRECADGGGETE